MHRCPLVRKVEEFLSRLDLGDGMVVAVSGGPDSVALLRALQVLRPSACWLLVAHLNHQLRGGESDADEQFVRNLSVSLSSSDPSLGSCFERFDVAARAVGGNLENVARQVRYDWLADVARDAHVHWVATGHTADDQAETVLHRLLRGAGLKGLRGIAARRALADGIELVRPLLMVSRAEVLEFLEMEKQPYCLDRTNLDCRRTRNRIRHQLLPHLAEHYNPALVSILGQLAEETTRVYGEIEVLARKLLAEAERPRAGPRVILDRQIMAAAPRNLIREMFRLLWEREGWALGKMSFAAWDRLAGLALGEIAAVDLPGGVQARQRERVVQIGKV